MTDCLIALGSNIGDRASMLDRCIQQFCSHPQIQWVAQSDYQQTEPVGGPAGQPAFLNSALRIATSLEPVPLLRWAMDIEQQLGRSRHERWGPRLIDIDLLLYGEQVLQLDQLELPHPRMAVRRFVLEPAVEIAADMIHPTTGWSLGTLWRNLCHAPPYIALAGAPCSGKTTIAKRLARQSGIQAILEPARALPEQIACGPHDLVAMFTQTQNDAIATRGTLLHEVSKLLDMCSDIHVVTDFWASQPPLTCPPWYDVRSGGVNQPDGEASLPPPPKVVVLLEIPANQIMDRLLARICGEPQPDSLARIDACIEQYCGTLAQLARTPGNGPILSVRGDVTGMMSEIEAAMAAMEIGPQQP